MEGISLLKVKVACGVGLCVTPGLYSHGLQVSYKRQEEVNYYFKCKDNYARLKGHQNQGSITTLKDHNNFLVTEPQGRGRSPVHQIKEFKRITCWLPITQENNSKKSGNST